MVSLQKPSSIEAKVNRALARSRCYTLLAQGFTYPEAELVSTVGDGRYGRELQKALADLDTSRELEEALGAFQSWALNIQDTDPARWGATYLELLGNRPLDRPLPYETEWGQPHEFMKTQSLADIAGFYRAFGVEPSEMVRERLDYIGTELEFMAYLAFKEGYALSQGWVSQSRVCRKAQRSFLAQHLGRWGIPFCTAFQGAARATFYGHLAPLAQAYLRLELRRFRIPKSAMGLYSAPISQKTTSDIQLDDDCQWCSYAPVASHAGDVLELLTSE